MGPRIRLRTRLWLGGLAAGGVAVAHILAFLLAAPDPFRREELLKTTGHGGWPLLVTVAMGALVVALAGFAVGRLRDPRQVRLAPFYLGTARRLVIMQVVGFLLLEAGERLATGKGLAGLSGLPFESVIAIGMVAQVLVALAGAMLLALLDRVVGGLVLFFGHAARAPRRLLPLGTSYIRAPLPRIASGPANLRGPPRRT
ncbi:MAG: hypothetical protein ACRDIZ_10520 [Actinomycetota bacterium]